MKGFFVAADAIVPCKVCGAVEGEPCAPCEGDELKRGYVHFSRCLSRLLLTAKARPGEKEIFERKALKMLREHLKKEQRA